MSQKLIFNPEKYIFEPDPEHEIAFWDYDKFPYTLWGTVTRREGANMVRVKEFSGYIFTAKLVLPYRHAIDIIKELEQLKLARETEIKEIENCYKHYLADLSFCYNIPMPKHVFV